MNKTHWTRALGALLIICALSIPVTSLGISTYNERIGYNDFASKHYPVYINKLGEKVGGKIMRYDVRNLSTLSDGLPKTAYIYQKTNEQLQGAVPGHKFVGFAAPNSYLDVTLDNDDIVKVPLTYKGLRTINQQFEPSLDDMYAADAAGKTAIGTIVKLEINFKQSNEKVVVKYVGLTDGGGVAYVLMRYAMGPETTRAIIIDIGALSLTKLVENADSSNGDGESSTEEDGKELTDEDFWNFDDSDW